VVPERPLILSLCELVQTLVLAPAVGDSHNKRENASHLVIHCSVAGKLKFVVGQAHNVLSKHADNMNDSVWWDGIDGDNLACRPGNEDEVGIRLPCLVFTRILPSILMAHGLALIYMTWTLTTISNSVQPVGKPNATRGKLSHATRTNSRGKRAAGISSRPNSERPVEMRDRSGMPTSWSSGNRSGGVLASLVNRISGVKVVTMHHRNAPYARGSIAQNVGGRASIAPPPKKNLLAVPKNNHAASTVLLLGAATISTQMAMLIHGHGTMYPSNTLRGRVGDFACK
jgi:hypothetical protein